MACFGTIADYNPEFIWSSGTASVSWYLHSVQYRCKSVCFLVHCKAEPSRHLNPLTLASLSCFPSSSSTPFPCLCLCNCQCSFSVFFFILLIYLFIYFFFFWAVKLIIPSAWGDFSTSTWSIRPTTGCRSRSTPLRVRRNLFWQLSRDGNLHGLGMSHTMTASPKPSFRAPWRVGIAVVGRRNARWTTSKSGHPCPCLNCPQGPPAGKSGRGSLLNQPSCPPMSHSVKGLNWTDKLISEHL